MVAYIRNPSSIQAAETGHRGSVPGQMELRFDTVSNKKTQKTKLTTLAEELGTTQGIYETGEFQV